jgi:hypothetical protein
LSQTNVPRDRVRNQAFTWVELRGLNTFSMRTPGGEVVPGSLAQVVYPTQVAEWAGHGVDVLLRIYAKCVVGQDELAKRRISEALRQD